MVWIYLIDKNFQREIINIDHIVSIKPNECEVIVEKINKKSSRFVCHSEERALEIFQQIVRSVLTKASFEAAENAASRPAPEEVEK